MVSAKYWRINLFYFFCMRFMARMRRRRMLWAVKILGIENIRTILDLGGEAEFWRHPFLPTLQITILNLPGTITVCESQHRVHYIEGDACRVEMPDKSFDLAFSNSVIEHVGDRSKREEFAQEVRRIGRSYWVQTPARWFPIEAHTGMPFWWFYPMSLRRFLIRRWRQKLPAWTDMVEGTDIVSRRELRALFPEARILVERFCGVPKSYIAIFTKT